jgi:hypothetical protein
MYVNFVSSNKAIMAVIKLNDTILKKFDLLIYGGNDVNLIFSKESKDSKEEEFA